LQGIQLENIFLPRNFTQRFWTIFSLVGLLILSTDFSVTYKSVNEPLPLSVEVNYINVTDHDGIGDSILIRSSEGKVALIDGGFPNSGACKYLESKNIDFIDLMVLSHPHDDHAGGLIEIMQKIPADKLVINGQAIQSPIYDSFEDEVKETGYHPIVAKAGDTLPFGSFKFQVLSPPRINPKVQNDNSLVLRLAVGKVIFLFTGDITKLQETWLIDNQAPLKSDILKIPHHGAADSALPAFILQVHPAIAIYSAGTGNSYNFPEQFTLNTLKSVGAKIYGTNVNGTITVTTDGNTYTVKTNQGGPLNP